MSDENMTATPEAPPCDSTERTQAVQEFAAVSAEMAAQFSLQSSSDPTALFRDHILKTVDTPSLVRLSASLRDWCNRLPTVMPGEAWFEVE